MSFANFFTGKPPIIPKAKPIYTPQPYKPPPQGPTEVSTGYVSREENNAPSPLIIGGIILLFVVVLLKK